MSTSLRPAEPHTTTKIRPASTTTLTRHPPARIPIYRYGSFTNNMVLRGPVEFGLR